MGKRPENVIVIAANATWNLVNFRSGLIAALVGSGYDVVGAGPHDATQEAALAALGARFLPVSIDSKGLSPLRDAGTMLRFYRLFRAERPVCFLGYTVKPNVYGSLAARLCGVPVIANISGLGTAFIKKSWLTVAVKALYRIGLGGARVVFFQNKEDLALFLENRLVRSHQAQLLAGSGIDTVYFSPAPAPLRDEKEIVFLLMARLVRDKGVVEYVEAARRMKRTHPGLHFQILGFLDVENRTAITRGDIEAWQAEGLIEYLGSAADVRPAIANADVVVLPSYREGTSRVLLEAAAMARPTITTDVPGCRDVVDDGVNGLLCRVRDAADLADKMERIADAGRDRRAEMGNAGRAKVMRDFDERLVIDRYLSAIDAVISRAGR